MRYKIKNINSQSMNNKDPLKLKVVGMVLKINNCRLEAQLQLCKISPTLNKMISKHYQIETVLPNNKIS